MAESKANNVEVAEATKEETTKKPTESTKESTLYYFYTQGCGWCKKADPIVDELIADGYDILKLDLADGENGKLQQEVKSKYNQQCGTPYFVDGSSGNTICGFRDKETLEKWANGEEIPVPPKPNSPPPRPPQDWKDTKVVDAWKEEYGKWRDENDHVKNIPAVEQTMERIKKQQEMMKQRQAQGGAPGMAGPDMARVESKLDALMNHLGVKWTSPKPATVAPAAPVAAPKKLASNSNQPSAKTGKQPNKK